MKANELPIINFLQAPNVQFVIPEGMIEARTFGIHRITEVSVWMTSKIRRSKYANQLKGFEGVIGLDFHDNTLRKLDF